MSLNFNQRVLGWFHDEGRHDLPWQKQVSAYRVWVSEIMLQQTQVTTVIDYFQRFMKRFNNVKQLALADSDEVLSYWSGLGYYARARNLHKTAQIIHHEYHGRFPKTVEQLQLLPGIGRSTAGAIVSLAFNQYATILDGNVKRVLARHAAIGGWPGKKHIHDQLWEIAENRTPGQNASAYTQAMMDLGALICTRTQPLCDRCPVQDDCIAYHAQQQHLYPGKKPKTKKPTKATTLLIIQSKPEILLLEKRPSTGIWGGLWSFPETESISAGIEKWQNLLSTSLQHYKTLPKLEHSFTHYDLTLSPVILQCAGKRQPKCKQAKWCWYQLEQALPGGIPSPVAKLLKQYKG